MAKVYFFYGYICGDILAVPIECPECRVQVWVNNINRVVIKIYPYRVGAFQLNHRSCAIYLCIQDCTLMVRVAVAVFPQLSVTEFKCADLLYMDRILHPSSFTLLFYYVCIKVNTIVFHFSI